MVLGGRCAAGHDLLQQMSAVEVPSAVQLVLDDATWASDIVGVGNIFKCLNIWP